MSFDYDLKSNLVAVISNNSQSQSKLQLDKETGLLSVFMFLPETAVRFVLWTSSSYIPWELYMSLLKDLMKGKLFQRCTHLLYLGVLSLGGNVSTRRMSKPDMGSIFHKTINEIFWS